ncbi:integrase [Ancylobacter sp. 3268]|uniref:tyrosine-type recombinase/integrase n=1 Tax=Ancylobacter sp. 3268 TaxID=2817752 RepID=UPI002860510B|nr:tyrosine-type recombinase/integrase [Ancylobacter sp. 3268]MDR6952336.1 integrase [Ancylobacter sp. 3268]
MELQGVMLDRLKYVYEDTDRHGNARYYFWRGKGSRKVRIRAVFGTPAFRKTYDDLLADSAPPEKGAIPGRAIPGTYKWLCQRYFGECAEFKLLSADTRKERRRILERTFDEPITPESTRTFGEAPLDRFNARAVRALRDRKMDTPEAANARIKALRHVFKWAMAEEVPGVTGNPARDVTFFKGSDEGHHTWTLDEVAAFEARHPVGTKARLAFSLLLYTGVRRSDVVKLGRQMIRNGWLYFTETKGRARRVKQREIPLLPELRAVLDVSPSGNLTFLITEYGAPFSEAGFGNWFRDRCDEAGLKHCSAHGLRKAGATIAATAGATEHQLMAIFGWESPKQAAVYTRKANRRRLAGDAMHLMVPTKTGTDLSHFSPSEPEGEKEI